MRKKETKKETKKLVETLYDKNIFKKLQKALDNVVAKDNEIEDFNIFKKIINYVHEAYGTLIQLAGVMGLGVGIVLEMTYKADVYLILITLGSIIFAIGTKIKGS